MRKTEGKVDLYGSVAYAPQNPWSVRGHVVRPSFTYQMRRIMSGTIKDNILFSHHYDDTFYNLVLDGKCSYSNKRFPNSPSTSSLRTQTGLGPSF